MTFYQKRSATIFQPLKAQLKMHNLNFLQRSATSTMNVLVRLKRNVTSAMEERDFRTKSKRDLISTIILQNTIQILHFLRL